MMIYIFLSMDVISCTSRQAVWIRVYVEGVRMLDKSYYKLERSGKKYKIELREERYEREKERRGKILETPTSQF